MKQPKKEVHPITVRMDNNLYTRLEQYCTGCGQKVGPTIAEAVKFFLEAQAVDKCSK